MRNPEITINSEFGSFIINLITSNNWIQKVLEIGSGSGNGSTQCFILALAKKQNPSLTCIEPNLNWFQDLIENTKKFSFVKCINKTTISYDNSLIKTFDDYWNNPLNTNEPIKHYETKKLWYEQDLLYFKNISRGMGAIENEETYDCVLIDGSEFLGYSEYNLLKNRTKCFILDDINAFKCINVHNELLNNSDWLLIDKGSERNGWSCFIKKEKI